MAVDIDTRILRHLNREKKPSRRTMTVMCEELDLHRQTVRSHLAVMREKGWVVEHTGTKESQGTGKARTIVFELTTEGRDVTKGRAKLR